MQARLHYCDRDRSLTVRFDRVEPFVIKNIELVNMKDVRNLLLIKDRAVDCILYLMDERVGKLANYLITIPDGKEIQDEITVELKGNFYRVRIDKGLEFVEFLKDGETKPYKVKKSSCNCMAWVFSKDKPKHCKHTDMLALMGIDLKEPPKKIVLSKEEKKKWSDAFKAEKIKDKEAKQWIIENSKQLIIDHNATSVRQWFEVYQKVKKGELTFTKREEI